MSAFAFAWRKWLEYRSDERICIPVRRGIHHEYARLDWCVSLERIASKLQQRSAAIWRLYFLGGLPHAVVADRLHITRRQFFWTATQLREVLGREFVRVGLVDAPDVTITDRRKSPATTGKLIALAA